jgi:hypothetical protein
MPTVEEQLKGEYLYRFDIYWRVVLHFLPTRDSVTLPDIFAEIKKQTTDKRVGFKFGFKASMMAMTTEKEDEIDEE